MNYTVIKIQSKSDLFTPLLKTLRWFPSPAKQK